MPRITHAQLFTLLSPPTASLKFPAASLQQQLITQFTQPPSTYHLVEATGSLAREGQIVRCVAGRSRSFSVVFSVNTVLMVSRVQDLLVGQLSWVIMSTCLLRLFLYSLVVSLPH